MRLGKPVAALVLALSSLCASAELNWSRTNGPQSPGVLQFLPFNGDTGFAVTGGGLYKTTNAGQSWTLTGAPFLPTGRPIQSRAQVLATDGTRLYLTYSPEQGGGKGLYVSSDGGTTWAPYLGTGAGAISTDTGSNPVADAGFVYLLQEGIGIKRSPHGGANWTDITPPGIVDFGLFDLDQQFMVNGVLCVYVTGGGDFIGIKRSANQGATWTDGTFPANVFEAQFAVSPDRTVAYMAASNGIYRSTDSCATWEKQDAAGLPNGFTRPDFAFGVGHDGALYWNRATNLYRSTDGGDTFTYDGSGDLQALFDAGGGIVTTVGSIGQTTLSGTVGSGVFRRLPTWTVSNTGAASSFVEAVINVNGTLYAAVGGNGVHVSTNGGSTWTPRNNGLRGGARALLAFGGAVYAINAKAQSLNQAGVYKTTDGGQTWTPAGNGIPDFSNVNAIVTDGAALYIAVNSNFVAQEGQVRVYKSTDGAANWIPSGAGLPNEQSIDMAANSNVILVVMGGRTVWRSLDGAASWVPAGATGDAAGGAFQANRVWALPSGLYASNGGGTGIGQTSISKDDGASWDLRSIESASDLFEDANGTLYGSVSRSFGTGRGLPTVSVLKRGANTWTSEIDGLALTHLGRAIQLHGPPALRNGALFGAMDAGVWTSALAAPPTVDTEPDPFHFVDQVNAPEGSPSPVSAPVTITGLSAPAPVFIRGGGGAAFQINCTGPFFSDDTRTISNNQTVCVKHNNSPEKGRITNTSLVIGGVGDTFSSSISNGPPDTTPNAFTFTDQAGVATDSTITSNAVVISGINAAAAISVTGGTYSIGCTTVFTGAAGTINNNQSVCVRHTSAQGNNAATNTVLTVGGVSDTFTSTTQGPPDTTPDAFQFVDQAGVAPGSTITSAPVTIAGINAAAPVSVTGGTYSVGCTANYTAAAGTITSGQTLCARHTSASGFAANVDTIVTVGGVSDTFRSTTRAADVVPDAFTFTDQGNVALSSVVTSNAITVQGIEAAVPISVTGGSYSIGCGNNFVTAAGTIANGQAVCVRHTAASANSTATNTTLTIGGVSDTFTSTTVPPGPPDTTPDAFSFPNATGAEPGASVQSADITIAGINTAAPISIAGGQYRIGTQEFTGQAGTIAPGQAVRVRGVAAAFGQTATVTLTVGGVSGQFRIISRAANQDTVTDPSGQAVAVQASAGTLANLANTATRPAGAPDDLQYPNGFFSFDVTGLANGATATVTLNLPAGSNPTSYLKCDDGACSNFAGAAIAGNVVTLTLVDGGAGDADGIANGTIRDPGAPAKAAPPAAPRNDDGGGALGHLVLVLLGLGATLRRRAGR